MTELLPNDINYESDEWKELISFYDDSSGIRVKREYNIITGSANAGIVLAQIVYWFRPDLSGRTKLRVKKKDGYWLAKTVKELSNETGLPKGGVITGKKILREMHIITTKNYRFSGNKTTHIWLNIKTLLKYLRSVKIDKSHLSKQSNRFDENVTPVTETTASITASTTLHKIRKDRPNNQTEEDCVFPAEKERTNKGKSELLTEQQDLTPFKEQAEQILLHLNTKYAEKYGINPGYSNSDSIARYLAMGGTPEEAIEYIDISVAECQKKFNVNPYLLFSEENFQAILNISKQPV
ncbi:hypothetical protein ACFL5H_03915 [Candidatus Latescibacterota bacterium]